MTVDGESGSGVGIYAFQVHDIAFVAAKEILIQPRLQLVHAPVENPGFLFSLNVNQNPSLIVFKIQDLAAGKEVFHLAEFKTVIIFLYFLNYIYDWDAADWDSSKSYEDFYRSLSDLLDRCGLPYLYYGDPFDWFVLRSIYEYELFDPYDDDPEDEPLEYFVHQVIALAYGSDF